MMSKMSNTTEGVNNTDTTVQLFNKHHVLAVEQLGYILITQVGELDITV